MDYIASYVFKPNRVLNYLSVIRDSLKDTEVSVVMEVSKPASVGHHLACGLNSDGVNDNNCNEKM